MSAEFAALNDGGGGGGNVYSTMRGTTSYLNTLKTHLTGLKNLCNSDILQKDSDEWSKVQNILNDLANEVDNVVNDCKTQTAEMEKIDDLL